MTHSLQDHVPQLKAGQHAKIKFGYDMIVEGTLESDGGDNLRFPGSKWVVRYSDGGVGVYVKAILEPAYIEPKPELPVITTDYMIGRGPEGDREYRRAAGGNGWYQTGTAQWTTLATMAILHPGWEWLEAKFVPVEPEPEHGFPVGVMRMWTVEELDSLPTGKKVSSSVFLYWEKAADGWLPSGNGTAHGSLVLISDQRKLLAS